MYPIFFNWLKCKYNARIKRKFKRTNGRPLKGLLFFVPTGQNRNYPSISSLLPLAPPLHNHVDDNLSLDGMEKKVFSFDTESFRNFQPKINFG